MQIILNGSLHELSEAISITALLHQLQVDVRQVAVEKNGEIISCSKHDDAQLQQGDVLELVEFVGGG